ncbi:serine O-acetyltransferase [Gillisia mitskevichiae]|uniref:Serine acetyltransferase n=1 Tax=Gillisia mitskevichiae TaxID=270921 RepID=A0A495PM98_9FLAO|nr:serine acetyltransferase [Gillisia mitskevichiae]RKS50588.1 serine O-acetyltransferase [Gillisia mitskevichiae]
MNDILIDSKRFSSNVFPGIFNTPGMRFMFFFRLCNTYKNTPVALFFKFYFKGMQAKYGFQIPHSTKIGAGLFLGHYGNIVINAKSIIGKNCNISQGVTIGAVNRGKNKGCPVIGDEVWIGANSVIVGNIKIGNNALIAPLTFVNRDVPENALVVGNPGEIVNYSGSEGYINNKILNNL